MSVGRSAAAMPYGVPTVSVAPTVVPGDGFATVSMGATDASQGATIIEWVVSGYDNAGETVTNKVATANPDGSFSLKVTLPLPNVYGREWHFMAVPRVQSAGGQIKEGGQSPVSAGVQPNGAMAKPDVQIVVQQGVTGTDANILFSITSGDTNGHPTDLTFTYASTWGNGTANGAKQFSLPIPMTATGTVTVTQHSSDGATSSFVITVLPTISVDAGTAVLTVRYVPEKPLFCQVLTGTTVSDKKQATDTPDGSSSYHKYSYSYAGVTSGTAITLQCGGDNNNPTTYQITTTR